MAEFEAPQQPMASLLPMPRTMQAPQPSKESTDVPSNDNVDATGDFSLPVSNDKPTAADLAKAAEIPLLSTDGTSRTFESLYTSTGAPKQVLIIFVRHFFCGVSPFPFSTAVPLLPPPPPSPLTPPPRGTGLPRIPPHAQPLHPPRNALRPPNPDLHNHHRLRPTVANPHVHLHDALPVPHIRRAHAQALRHPRHDVQPVARPHKARVHAEVAGGRGGAVDGADALERAGCVEGGRYQADWRGVFV